MATILPDNSRSYESAQNLGKPLERLKYLVPITAAKWFCTKLSTIPGDFPDARRLLCSVNGLRS
jgi:hypothetical protein